MADCARARVRAYAIVTRTAFSYWLSTCSLNRVGQPPSAVPWSGGRQENKKQSSRVPFPEEIHGHPRADNDHEPANPGLRQFLSTVSTEVSAHEGSDDHDPSLLPHHRMRENKRHHSSAVDD